MIDYGIACNHIGCSEIAEGAKCYVTWLNPGNKSERVQIWCRSRGGRSIVKIEDIRHLRNFRARWFPEHVRIDNRNLNGCDLYEKDRAERIARAMDEASPAHPLNENVE